jgi:hypothetical protein
MIFQKVILVFPSLNQLWKFVKEVSLNYSDFNPEEFTLVCDCMKDDIRMVKEKYGVRLRVPVT